MQIHVQTRPAGFGFFGWFGIRLVRVIRNFIEVKKKSSIRFLFSQFFTEVFDFAVSLVKLLV